MVGAGASAEVGLPGWRELVEKLLIKVGLGERVAEENLAAFCDWTIASEGLPAAGSMARAALGDRFPDEVQRLLYENVPEPRLPGPTARAVARIRDLWGEACEIATTNYDVLLEEALKEFFPKTIIKSRTDESAGTPGHVVVRHLHGLITETKKQGKIVLSEADYHKMAIAEAWQETYFRKRLGESTCLLVGTSVTDPNLLRYLYRHPHKQPVVVVLVRQADEWPGSESLTSPVRLAREQVAMMRWREMGVMALYADFYSQSAQFLWEVVRRREQKSAYKSYGTRLMRWEEEVDKQVLRLRDPAAFPQMQDGLQQQARIWLDNVVTQIEKIADIDRDERLAVHLWARLPSRRALVLAVASDRAWRDPRVLEPKPITFPTDWIAVKAFCRGVPWVWSIESTISKWNYIRAIPVYLEGEPWGLLLVGVVTLTSTKSPSSSVLSNLPPKILESISVYLADNSADLLTPVSEP
jgi:hypothetical protein